MKRLGIVFLSVLSVSGLMACQRDDKQVNEKLDQISKDVAEIKEQLKKGVPGARQPQRPQRPRPNPNDVYSVPIDGAAFKGPQHAKVTVVEAFEFA